MIALIEIAGDDVAALDDAGLRELVGLLCEADYRKAGLRTKGITWGGNQDARDGGLDVVVRDEISPPAASFIPRKTTGFQVKKPDMPASEIRNEMRPKGVLRESIKALIQEDGAYIIVSSTGSTTDAALTARLNAMKDAVADEENYEKLHLDFFDRGRLATWVRAHTSLILWVRNRIGKPLKGWRSYDNWAKAPGGIEEEYLLDQRVRLHDSTANAKEGLSVEAGLLRVRSALASPAVSIRLTGLSGVGKTRFAQAIFDQRIGERAIDPSLAFYTDISFSPVPDPATLASQLINDKTRAILIVDNCPPALHNQLTQICSESHSSVSLLTVEYDVRDDLPEETHVFRLEPASDELIEALIRRRASHISQVDAHTIATVSGGNARVAIAIAGTVQKDENLSGLRNEELFDRVFRQRHDESQTLLDSAEACALVYSFEGTDIVSEDSELNLLASLFRKTGAELFRDVVELQRRELIQTRGVWRALLPQAIANRLARRALESIPTNALLNTIVDSGSERLLRSFSRRLSFLHDCTAAIHIVDQWLEEDGLIGAHLGELSTLGIAILRNVAPVSPEATMAAIERAANGDAGGIFTSRANTNHQDFIRLLRNLAYDAAMFPRCIEVMTRFALSENENARDYSARDVMRSLFYIYLSGTHATVEDRADIIRGLMSANEFAKHSLALHLLDAALESTHFTSTDEFSFGARSRDYGYEPKTRNSISHWFTTFIGICVDLAVAGNAISDKAARVLANSLRGLWTHAKMFDAIEDAAKRIQSCRPWTDGWIAVKGIIRYDAKRLSGEKVERLRRLEQSLKPRDLLGQAKVFALAEQNLFFDLDDDYEDDERPSAAWHRAAETAQDLGGQIAESRETLNILLPEIISTNNPRIWSFGRGLAEGCSDKEEVFGLLRKAFEASEPERRNLSVIKGFLSWCAENDSAFYNAKLDGVLNDDVLGGWFPVLQASAAIDRRGVERLRESLKRGIAPIDRYRQVAYGRVHESIADEDLQRLIAEIVATQEGVDVAVEILQMRFYGIKERGEAISHEWRVLARNVLSAFSFEDRPSDRDNRDYVLAEIAELCLAGEEGVDAAKMVAENLTRAFGSHRAFAFNYSGLLRALARSQSRVFLDVFLAGNDREKFPRSRIYFDSIEERVNPLDEIPDADLMLWCENDPSFRYPKLMALMRPFHKSRETGKLAWKPVVHEVLERAPDLERVFQNLEEAMWPTSWSGSRADIAAQNSELFRELFVHSSREVRTRAKVQYAKLEESIREERERELRRNQRRNESFE